MRERDLDLIAALVEGRLEDEGEARALIASSSEHRSEYEAQKLAFETLSAVPTAQMAEHERAALRRDVWTALQAQPASQTDGSPWYLRWSYAAAAVVIVVGVAGVVSQGGDDEAADNATALVGATSQTDVTPSDNITTPAATAQDDVGSDEGAQEAGSDGGAQELASEAEVAQFFSDAAVKTREDLTRGAGTTPDIDGFIAAHASCVESAGLVDYEAVAELPAEVAENAGLDSDKGYLVAVPADVSFDENTPIAFVDAETCVIAYTEGE